MRVSVLLKGLNVDKAKVKQVSGDKSRIRWRDLALVVDSGKVIVMVDRKPLLTHTPERKTFNDILDRPYLCMRAVRSGAYVRDICVGGVDPRTIMTLNHDERRRTCSLQFTFDGATRQISESDMMPSEELERNICSGMECTSCKPALRRCFPPGSHVEYFVDNEPTRGWMRGKILGHVGAAESRDPRSYRFRSNPYGPPIISQRSGQKQIGRAIISFGDAATLWKRAVPFAQLGKNKIRLDKRYLARRSTSLQDKTREAACEMFVAFSNLFTISEISSKRAALLLIRKTAKFAKERFLNWNTALPKERLCAIKIIRRTFRGLAQNATVDDVKSVRSCVVSLLLESARFDDAYLSRGNRNDEYAEVFSQCDHLLAECVESVSRRDNFTKASKVLLFGSDDDQCSVILDDVQKCFEILVRFDFTTAQKSLLRTLKVDTLSPRLGQFDRSSTFPGLTLSDDLRTLSIKMDHQRNARFGSSWLTGYVGSKPLRSGVHFVEFRVNSTNHNNLQTRNGAIICGHLMFGVSGGLGMSGELAYGSATQDKWGHPSVTASSHPFVFAKKPSLRSRSWLSERSLWQDDNMLSERANYGPILHYINQNHRVGMLLDLRTSPGRLIYFVDGVCYGEAFHNVITPVRPYISICIDPHDDGRKSCSKDESVTLLPTSFTLRTTSEAPIHAPSSIHESAQQMAQALVCAKALSDGSKLPDIFMRKTFMMWKLWRRGKWSIFSADIMKAGGVDADLEFPVEIDRSSSAVSQVSDTSTSKLSVGSRVRVQRTFVHQDTSKVCNRTRVGTIIGTVGAANPPCFAFIEDGAHGGSVQMLTPGTEGIQAHLLSSNDKNDREASKSTVALPETIEDDDENELRATFDRIFGRDNTEIRRCVKELMLAANRVSETRGLSPFSMSFQDLLSAGASNLDENVGPLWVAMLHMNLLVRHALFRVDFGRFSDSFSVAAEIGKHRQLLLRCVKENLWTKLLNATNVECSLKDDG
eukprot:g3526.t1